MEWWDKERQSPARRAAPPKPKAKLPFDFLLLVNSAAPAIYAKELRDFLEADRVALETAGDPDADVPTDPRSQRYLVEDRHGDVCRPLSRRSKPPTKRSTASAAAEWRNGRYGNGFWGKLGGG